MSELTGAEKEYRIVIAHFEGGRYEEMYHAAARLVQSHPGHGKGWHMAGLAALICGQSEIAFDALRRASSLQAENPEVWDHLATACNFLGRLGEARACFDKSIALDGQRAETWINAGKNLKDLGDKEAARAAYQRAIALKPQLAEAHNNLGVILLEDCRYADAATAFNEAIRANPAYVLAHCNLAIALKELGRHEEALQACRKALELDPHNAKSWNNLGNVEHELGREEDALAAYRQAAAVAPDDPEIRNNLGAALLALKRPQEAAPEFRMATGLRPDYADAWNNLGNALPDLDGKLAAFRRAVAIEPLFALAHSNLLFNLHYLPEPPLGEVLAEAKAYGRALHHLSQPRSAWANDRDIDRPLNIGLVSADFCEHPVAYFLHSVLTALDPQRLVLHGYYNERKEDEWTQRFRAAIPLWRSIAGQADGSVAEQIARDRIDILIDLSGHTAGHRLPVFALRPAPVQVSWLGYFGSTGAPGMDYVLADPWGVPEGDEGQFTEAIWRLPETRLCFTPPPPVEIGPVPQLNSGQVTFGCFNNFNKINDRVIAVWACLFARRPGARLFLKNSRADQAGARDELMRRLVAQGIGAERVRFEGSSPREDYLRAYNRVDISLDPFPYPGGTTTVESLWMGVPVLTLAGNSLLSRQGEGLLQNAGLAEWIAASPDAYVDQAIALAGDTRRLGELRRNLRVRLLASPLLDAPRFGQFFDVALRRMWRRYCTGVESEANR